MALVLVTPPAFGTTTVVTKMAPFQLVNLSFRSGPIRPANRLAINFPRGSFGNLWPELDRLRRFYASKFRFAVGDDALFSKRFSGTGNDDRLNGFAPGVVRDADHGAF